MVINYKDLRDAIAHWCNTCDEEWGGEDLALGLIEDIELNQGGNCLDHDIYNEDIVLTECQKHYITAQCFNKRPYPSKEGYIYA